MAAASRTQVTLKKVKARPPQLYWSGPPHLKIRHQDRQCFSWPGRPTYRAAAALFDGQCPCRDSSVDQTAAPVPAQGTAGRRRPWERPAVGRRSRDSRRRSGRPPVAETAPRCRYDHCLGTPCRPPAAATAGSRPSTSPTTIPSFALSPLLNVAEQHQRRRRDIRLYPEQHGRQLHLS